MFSNKQRREMESYGVTYCACFFIHICKYFLSPTGGSQWEMVESAVSVCPSVWPMTQKPQYQHAANFTHMFLTYVAILTAIFVFSNALS